jgi:hypothetical protein
MQNYGPDPESPLLPDPKHCLLRFLVRELIALNRCAELDPDFSRNQTVPGEREMKLFSEMFCVVADSLWALEIS